MTISDSLGLTGPAPPCPSDIARMLDDDPITALYFAQIFYWTAGGTRVAQESAQQVYEATGITERRQERARKKLIARGWLKQRRFTVHGNRTHLLWTIDAPLVRDEVYAWVIKHGRVPAGHTRPADHELDRAENEAVQK